VQLIYISREIDDSYLRKLDVRQLQLRTFWTIIVIYCIDVK
jgi:hypothetical protein